MNESGKINAVVEAVQHGNYEKVRNQLFLKVMNIRENKDLLQGIPYFQFEDMALTCWILVESREDGISSMPYKHGFFSEIPLSQVRNDALNNSSRLFPPVIMPLREMMLKLMKEMPVDEAFEWPDAVSEDNAYYVLGNERGINGASALWYPGIMEELYQIMGGDYFVLPTSLHELMILPKDNNHSKQLKKLLHEGNQTLVTPEEILSDEIYVYDGREKVLRAA